MPALKVSLHPLHDQGSSDLMVGTCMALLTRVLVEDVAQVWLGSRGEPVLI